jgi:hypothetical protein
LLELLPRRVVEDKLLPLFLAAPHFVKGRGVNVVIIKPPEIFINLRLLDQPSEETKIFVCSRPFALLLGHPVEVTSSVPHVIRHDVGAQGGASVLHHAVVVVLRRPGSPFL